MLGSSKRCLTDGDLKQYCVGVDVWLVPARQLSLRRSDVCVACDAQLPAGTRAWWDQSERTVTCVVCWDCAEPVSAQLAPPSDELESGPAGASLERAYERRKQNREQRTRDAHPHIGGLLLAMRSTPQHELAFHQGAVAERAVADSLAKRTAGTAVITLHNRRMPGGRGDIDHIAIAPTGVYVIDTKDWKGKVEIQTPWRGAAKLLIRGRDCTKLIDGLERQLTAVRDALDRDGHHEIPIRGALCFTQADLPFLRTQKCRGHLLLYRKALAKQLNADGPLDPPFLENLARHLAVALPPAR
jgi:Nuclease-related domain